MNGKAKLESLINAWYGFMLFSTLKGLAAPISSAWQSQGCSFRFWPQMGQRPRQSSRQTTTYGMASMSASSATAEQSTSSSR